MIICNMNENSVDVVVKAMKNIREKATQPKAASDSFSNNKETRLPKLDLPHYIPSYFVKRNIL